MNRLLVAPSAVDLTDAITAAVGSLKKTRRSEAVMSADDVAAAAAAALTGPAAEQLHRTRRGQMVTVTWWADFAGRRHVRVRAGTHTPRADGHPFAAVYPGVLQACGPHLLVACGCRAVGTLASLGWAGERCGPCQDRTDEGGPVTPPQVFPGGGCNEAIAFTPDGRELLFYDGGRHRVAARDLRTGATTDAPPHPGMNLLAVGFGPGGWTALAFLYGNVTLWDRESGRAVHSSSGSRCGRFSPCGGYAVTAADAPAYAVEWGTPETPLRPLTAAEVRAAGSISRPPGDWHQPGPRDPLVRRHLTLHPDRRGDGRRVRVAFSRCGGYAFAPADAGLAVYPPAGPAVHLTAPSDTGTDRVHAVAFSPDCETLAVGFELAAGDFRIRLVPWRRLVGIAGAEGGG